MILPQKQKLTYYAASLFTLQRVQIHNSNDAFVCKKTSAKLFFLLVFWNTLTRFYYMLLYMFESFLTVSTTFRICPCVCKTRKGNRKKLVILDWCCPKNKMFLIVFLFVWFNTSFHRKKPAVVASSCFFFCYKDGLCVYVFFVLFNK